MLFLYFAFIDRPIAAESTCCAFKSSTDTCKVPSSERRTVMDSISSWLLSVLLFYVGLEANDLYIMHCFFLYNWFFLYESPQTPKRFCGTPGPLTHYYTLQPTPHPFLHHLDCFPDPLPSPCLSLSLCVLFLKSCWTKKKNHSYLTLKLF